MLTGIKARVEGDSVPCLVWQFLEILLWLAPIASLLFALFLVFRRPRWWRPLLTAAFSATTLFFLFYAHQPLWLGILAVITTLAILRWSSLRVA